MENYAHIKNTTDLKKAIANLESAKMVQRTALSTDVHNKIESLKPVNLVKNAVSNIAASSSTRNKVLTAVAGLGVAFLTKKFMIARLSGGWVRTLAVNALKAGAVSFVANRLTRNAKK